MYKNLFYKINYLNSDYKSLIIEYENKGVMPFYFKKITLSIILDSVLSLASSNTIAWDSYDYNTGSYIEIGSGNLVRSGNEIEIYDYGDGSYKKTLRLKV